MAIFKKRQKVEKLEKTLTIYDANNEVVEIIDIIDEEPKVKTLDLGDGVVVELTDDQKNDIEFMTGIRTKYPEVKDVSKFITDACASQKTILDEANKDLSDEDKEKDQKALDALAKSDAAKAKILNDQALAKAKEEDERQQEIVKTEQARHKAAQESL